MTRRWLAAATLVMALAGCADEELAPAEIPVPATGAAEASPSAIPAVRAATHVAAVPRATKTKMTAGEQTNAGSGSRGLDGFVAGVRTRVPEVALDRRDEEIEEIAQQACAGLKGGKTAAAVVAQAAKLAGVDKPPAAELIKLAIDTVCPNQQDRAGEF
jgi:hypothetical protein